MNKMLRKPMLFVVALGIFLLANDSVFASEVEANSRIVQVTMYPDSALITRGANLKLDAGEHTIIFSNIIPDLDENSLRVSAQGNVEVKILGAQVRKEFLEEVPSQRIRQLKEEILKLEDERKKLEDNKAILLEEKQFLDSIRLYADAQIPKDLATKMPQVSDLENTFKFLDAKLKENFSGYSEYEFSLRALNEKLDVLKRQLAEISGSLKKLKRSIIVDLTAIKAEAVDLTVSYLVRGAAWQPVYEARANFERSEVELVSNGIVKQNTGEDWQDVELMLSTAKPAIGGNMPYVSPWFLRPYQPRVWKEEKRMANMAMQAKAPAVQYEALDLNEEQEPPQEVAYAHVEEKGVAVVYKLPKKVSVQSDGSEHKLPISAQVLGAKFEYSAYPRAVANAYLGSRVSNAANLQLLEGRVNIFLEGDFVGASSIPHIGPGEEFDLYLGVDENVKVKREQLEKKVDETLIGSIASPTKRTVFKYKLTVENYKPKKTHVKLFEAMPVSEDDRIKVKINQVSLEPKEKGWKDRKGVWMWELELEPKQKQEITYTFTIEHPREMTVEGL